jgi:hypothetical protein
MVLFLVSFVSMLNIHHTSPWKIGFVQSLFVVCYVLLFAFSINTVHNRFGDIFTSPVTGIPFFLTLFVFSALVCGGAVLGYPLTLVLEKNLRRALQIVGWSIAWFAAFLIAALAAGVIAAL